MLVSIRDCRQRPEDRRWIERAYDEYLEDLAQLNTGVFPVLIDDSPRKQEIFVHWFANEAAHPLIVLKGSEPVGFALVTRPRRASGTTSAVRSSESQRTADSSTHQPAEFSATARPADFLLSEFFISKPFRRIGIGRNAATLIFDRFAGEWEIVEYERNPSAVAFWRGVLRSYAGAKFEERVRHGEVRQRFSSKTASLRKPF